MGRKGVSKRKPKQVKNIKGSSNTQQGTGSAVQDLVKGKEAPAVNSGNTNSYTGLNKKNKKGK
jgi:hypothetical protein